MSIKIGLNKMWYTYNGILFGNKKNTAQIHATMDTDLENIRLSERSQTHRSPCYMISFSGKCPEWTNL